MIAGLAARGWRPLIAACAVLYAFALEIAIAGVAPGVEDPGLRLYICWSALLAMMAGMVLALIGTSAEDASHGTFASAASP